MCDQRTRSNWVQTVLLFRECILEEFMLNRFVVTAAGGVLLFGLGAVASAQTPPGAGQGAPAAPISNAVASPTYISIPLEITVNRPAAEVWKRVGKFCDIAEWLRIAAGCTITAGKDGEIGAIRSVAREVLVGRTDLSYTYTQPVNAARPYNLYHGTLEARPLTA